MYRARYQENRNWFFDDWVSFIGGEPDQYIKRSDEEVNSFEMFVKNEITNLSYLHFESIEAPILPQGLYEEHLSKFLTLFKRDQLLVVESSFFREHTSEVLDSIESFLSIRKFDWDRINLSPIFEGGYADVLDQSAAAELSKYYAPHNGALYKLLGTRYDWK